MRKYIIFLVFILFIASCTPIDEQRSDITTVELKWYEIREAKVIEQVNIESENEIFQILKDTARNLD